MSSCHIMILCADAFQESVCDFWLSDFFLMKFAEPLWLPSLPWLSLSFPFALYSFVVCLPIFSLSPSIISHMSSSVNVTRGAIFVPFCVISASFSPQAPPLLCYNRNLSRFPQIPSATPTFSRSFSICVSPLSFFSSPLPAPSLSVLLTCST